MIEWWSSLTWSQAGLVGSSVLLFTDLAYLAIAAWLKERRRRQLFHIPPRVGRDYRPHSSARRNGTQAVPR